MRDEVDVRPLISKLQKEGKSIYLPKVINRSDIAFFRYKEGDILEQLLISSSCQRYTFTAVIGSDGGKDIMTATSANIRLNICLPALPWAY